MKRFFILLVICLSPLLAYSQLGFLPKGYETLDTTVLRVFYEFSYPPTMKPVKKLAIMSAEDSLKQEKSTDYMILEIGKTGISKFYSDNNRQLDSMMMDMMKNPQKISSSVEKIKNSGMGKADEREIFKNYPAGKMTVTDQVSRVDAFSYEDELNGVQWQITTDTMTCLNYLCQKATGDFRGRNYEAWFAPDLPVNDGPFKFSGLPGLILYVTDSGHQYILKAVALDKMQTPLQFTKKDYVKTTRQEVDKMKRRFAEDPLGYMSNSFPGAQIPQSVPDGKGGTISREDLKMTYNPMELE